LVDVAKNVTLAPVHTEDWLADTWAIGMTDEECKIVMVFDWALGTDAQALFEFITTLTWLLLPKVDEV
jgi:hypothetical protein